MRKIQIDNKIYLLEEPFEVPPAFKDRYIQGSRMFLAEGHFGEAFFQLVDLPNAKIWVRTYHPDVDCTVTLSELKSYLGMHAALTGEASYSIMGIGEMRFKQLHANVLCLPHVAASFQLKAGTAYSTLDINFGPHEISVYRNIIHYADQLLEAVEKRKPLAVYDKPVPLTFELLNASRSLIVPPYSGAVQQIHTTMKVSELVFGLLVLHSAKCIDEHAPQAFDIDKFHEVKQFIADNYATHHTIPSMAKRLGINATAFKKGFKQSFGIAPFEFLARTRMENAITLLRNRKLSIGQVSDRVGFQSPSGFIKAFRKHFGHTPSQVRKALPS